MSQITYVQKILGDFNKNHIFFFAIVIMLLHFLNNYLQKYSINVYQGPMIIATYVLINQSISIYNFFMGGIVATIVSFIVYNLFTKIYKNVDIVNMNLVSFLSILFFMTIFNCINVAALAYSLSASLTIPKSQFQYLSSFIVACVLILFLSVLLLYLIKLIGTKSKLASSIGDSLTQLKQNIGLKF